MSNLLSIKPKSFDQHKWGFTYPSSSHAPSAVYKGIMYSHENAIAIDGTRSGWGGGLHITAIYGVYVGYYEMDVGGRRIYFFYHDHFDDK